MLIDIAWRRPGRTRLLTLHVLAALGAACALIASLAPSLAPACVGSPPPILCGKNYVFAKGIVNANVPADVDSEVEVQTLHFLNLIEFLNQCPPGPYQVTMTANVICNDGPNAGPFVFGPFNINEGFNEIPIEIPIPAGPARQCVLEVVSDLTLIDGMVLRQQGDQAICVVETVGETAPQMLVEVELIGLGGEDTLKEVAPSGASLWDLHITNNSPDQTFTGAITTTMTTVSDEADMVGGANSPTSGTFSSSGPLDTFLVEILGVDGDDFLCLPTATEPWLLGPQSDSTTIIVEPGETKVVRVGADTHGGCADGSCGEAVNVVDGVMDDGTPVTACAGNVVAVNSALGPPADPCDNNMVVAQASNEDEPVTPGVGMAYDCDGTQGKINFRTNESGIILQSDDGFHSGNTTFTRPTMIEGQFGRLNPEISFITPLGAPGAIFQFSFPIEIEIDKSFDEDIEDIVLVDVFKAEGTHEEECAPFVIGLFCVIYTDGTQIGIKKMMQVHANGVEQGNFNPVAMNILEMELTPSMPFIDVKLTCQAKDPGETPFIGFSTNVDFRAVASKKDIICYGDCDADGELTILDFLCFQIAFLKGDPLADCNGDGVLNILDFVCFQNEFNACLD